MREILFRGKRVDSGEWVQGCLVFIEASNVKTTDGKINKSVCCITKPYFPFEITVNDADNLDLALYRIIPETVGQYTGLTDKNGKKIFEGDIVDILTENGEIGVIAYNDGGFLVEADTFCVTFQDNINGTDVEIIGNIHDNPELLEESNNA